MATEPPPVPPPPLAAVDELAAGGPVAAGAPAGAIPGRELSDRVQTGVLYGLLTLIALLFFVPFLWTLATSFKTLPDTSHFTLIPHPWTISGYRTVLTKYDFERYAANSAGLSLVITCLAVFLATLGGYAFARLRFPGREVLFLLVLGTLMIPDQLRLVPIYQMLTNFPLTHWNLVDSYQGYILIKLDLAVALFLMRQYFLTIPRDLEEAAKLDGAGYFKTYARVMLPLAGPAVAAVAILQFQGAWNDFFWANLILQSPKHFTLTVGTAGFVQLYQTLWPEVTAAAVIAIVPIAVIYLFFQRYFVAGVASAGVKG